MPERRMLSRTVWARFGLGALAALAVLGALILRASFEAPLPPTTSAPAPWFGAPVGQPFGALAAIALVTCFGATARAAHLGWRDGRRWAVAGAAAAVVCVLALGAA